MPIGYSPMMLPGQQEQLLAALNRPQQQQDPLLASLGLQSSYGGFPIVTEMSGAAAAPPSIGDVPPPPTGRTRANQRNAQPVDYSDPRLLEQLRNAMAAEYQTRMGIAQPLIDYSQNMAGAGQDQQVDLTALAALTDQWTGSNFLQAYKPPKADTAMQQAFGARQVGEAGLMGAAEQQTKNIATLIGQERAQKEEEFSEWYRKQYLEIMHQQNQARAVGKRDPKAKILPSNAIQQYTEAQSTVGLAEELSGIVTQATALMGPVKGKWKWNPYDVEMQKLQSRLRLSTQRIGKMLEGGVLRKEDEVKYRKMLPNPDDLPEVALSKALNLERTLKQDLSNYMSNFGRGGYDISGFADQTEKYKADYKAIQTGQTPQPTSDIQKMEEELTKRNIKL